MDGADKFSEKTNWTGINNTTATKLITPTYLFIRNFLPLGVRN